MDVRSKQERREMEKRRKSVVWVENEETET